MTDTSLLLEIEGLTIRLDIRGVDTMLVDGVSLSMQKGEVLALVGESGSGKTLSSKSVLQLLPDNARAGGAVRLEGTDVLALSGAELKSVRGQQAAMIFQEPSTALNPVFTIGWQLEEGLKSHGVPSAERRKRSIELLRAVGIQSPEERLRQYPHEFSGGQKQRIVIAMALALRPKLIIADEPTTALDVTVQAEILDLLRRCKDEFGSAILIVTHNMGVVADIADTVAVMSNGKIVETGPVENIFYRPQHPYTRQLLDAVPRLQSQIEHAATASDAPPPGASMTSAVEVPVESPGQALQHQLVPPCGVRGPVALQVTDLDVVYHGSLGKPPFHAVHGVSFEISAGEVLGLVGESGSGKSTIGKALVGLAPLKGGEITLLGSDLRKLRGAARKASLKRVGIVFQDPASSFNPHLTVGECVVEGMVIHGVSRSRQERENRAAELLDAVQLPRAFASRYPYQLSGGQRQRVGIARALALRPDLIIADEPTSALDVSVQAKVLDLFVELQREMGFASLFISHDLAVIEALCDRVAVLRQGRLVELGSTQTVMQRPTEDYTRRLIAAVPVPDPVVQRVRREQYRERYLSA